jgi:hypothetical protein
LMVSGQNSPGQVIEPCSTVLAPVPLPVSLSFIMAMADHRGTGTGGAANSFRPSIVPDQLIALGIIDQGRQIDHLQRSHGSVPANGQCLPSQQPKASKERHNLLSDMGPMVVPLGSAASTLKPRMSHPEKQIMITTLPYCIITRPFRRRPLSPLQSNMPGCHSASEIHHYE